jgi:hypothetical protein
MWKDGERIEASFVTKLSKNLVFEYQNIGLFPVVRNGVARNAICDRLTSDAILRQIIPCNQPITTKRVGWMAPEIIQILIGITLLIMGRRMFWLFVGAAGFVTGSKLAVYFSIGGPEWAPMAVALFAGFIGAMFAILAQKLAVAVGGFVMGSYTAASIIFSLGLESTQWMWFALIVGGIIGSILVLAVFDWALIALSSIAGAMLIVQTGFLELPVNILLFLIMVSIGIVIQTRMLNT